MIKGNNKVLLNIGHAPVVTFTLYEAKVSKKQTELADILFRLAERTEELETQLEKAEKIENMRQPKASSNTLGGFESGYHKSPAKGRVPPKEVGMSAVNPGSRKRKPAQGVMFDWTVLCMHIIRVYLSYYVKYDVQA